MPYYPDVNKEQSGVGSGDANFGSGFTNFDKFLQPENIQWGKDNQGYDPSASNNWSNQSGFDQWMIDAARVRNPVQPRAPEINPPTQTPEPITIDKGPKLNPIDTVPDPGSSPNPGSGNYDEHGNPIPVDPNPPDPNAPPQSGIRMEGSNAFPMLDKKLKSGAW